MQGVRPVWKVFPCLGVDDVERAAEYYSRVLGFEVGRSDPGPPASVLVVRDGAGILLQADERAASVDVAGQARPGGFDPAPTRWDACLFVPDLTTTFEDLLDRAARLAGRNGVHPIVGDSFAVRDLCGNVVCFASAGRTPVQSAIRTVAQKVPPRALDVVRQARSRREERSSLEAFRSFYNDLPDKKNIFYMTFRHECLHWVVKALSHLPPSVNVVLVGSTMPAEEQAWLEENVDRPFHHVDIGADDKTIWEFWFDVTEQNWGAIDIDCFVLDPAVFDEFTAIDDDVVVNCAWSFDNGDGLRLAQTHLVFLNAQAIRAARAAGLPASPCTYNWHSGDRHIRGRRCFSRVPTARERRMMAKVVPLDRLGRPRIPQDGMFFDNLVVWQMVAVAAGYRINMVRDLERDIGQTSGNGARPQPLSDELLHIGGASVYDRYFYAPESRALYSSAEYAVLSPIAERLPPWYAQRHADLAERLRGYGLDPETTGDRIRDYLEGRGLSAEAIERALAPAL
jgi:catechol 2,3-dioxygenase-like lactoylglutathione lyase family enzyme